MPSAWPPTSGRRSSGAPPPPQRNAARCTLLSLQRFAAKHAEAGSAAPLRLTAGLGRDRMSYAIKVVCTRGASEAGATETPRAALVPLAFLANHSLQPHIVRFRRENWQAQRHMSKKASSITASPVSPTSCVACATLGR